MFRKVIQTGLLLLFFQSAAVAGDFRYSYVPAANAVIYRSGSATAQRLYLRDMSTGAERVLWEGEGRISSVKVHRQAGLIGFRQDTSQGKKLNVITIKGKLVREFPGRVYDFDFDPRGTRVLYVIGRPYDDESADVFESLGVYVGDFPTGASQKISDLGHEVAWAQFDGNCYVRIMVNPQRIMGRFRWNPPAGTLARVEHKGIHFSPTGEYYFKLGSYEDFGLYRTSDHSEIVIEDIAYGSGFAWRSEAAWSDDGTRLMVTYRDQSIGPHGRVTLIYDFPSGKLYRIFAHVLDWGRASNEVVVEEDSQFVFRTVDSFPQF